MAQCNSKACKLRRAKESAAQSLSPVNATLVPKAMNQNLSNIGNSGLAGLGQQPITPQITNQPVMSNTGGSNFSPATIQPGSAETWNETWHGRPESTMQFPLYNRQQEGGFQWALQNALQGLGNNQFDFTPFENQARQDFQQKTIPSISERFTALGAQGSSAFNQQLGQAGAGLETDLASLRSGYSQDQQRMLLSLLQLGLTPQFENTYSPAQPGVKQKLIQGAAAAAPELLGMVPVAGPVLKGAWNAGKAAVDAYRSNKMRVPGNFAT